MLLYLLLLLLFFTFMFIDFSLILFFCLIFFSSKYMSYLELLAFTFNLSAYHSYLKWKKHYSMEIWYMNFFFDIIGMPLFIFYFYYY